MFLCPPRLQVQINGSQSVYNNLWYNNGRWYAIVDGPDYVPSFRFSRNLEITTLHVEDAKAWAAALKWRAVTGDSLLFDFVFFMHPTGG